MSMSTYLGDALIKHILRKTTFTPPTSVYIALYTTNPTENNTGTEVTSGSYERVQLTGGFTVDNSGSAVNSASIVFNNATANWGNISYVGITNAATAGSLLFYGAMSASRAVYSGDKFTIPEKYLKVGLGKTYSGYAGHIVILSLSGWGYYLAQEILDHTLNNSAYSAPDVYVALLTTDVDRDGTGGVELSGSGYSRISHSGTGAWTSPVRGASSNATPITFITSCSASWANVGYMALYNAATAGSLLFTWQLPAPITLDAADGLKFDTGRLEVSLLPASPI